MALTRTIREAITPIASATKETDLSVYDADDLARVAASLNNRPSQTLGCLRPSEKFTELESVWP